MFAAWRNLLGASGFSAYVMAVFIWGRSRDRNWAIAIVAFEGGRTEAGTVK